MQFFAPFLLIFFVGFLAGRHKDALMLLDELKERLQDNVAGMVRILEMRIQALTLTGQVRQQRGQQLTLGLDCMLQLL
jgi:hypothetical protein